VKSSARRKRSSRFVPPTNDARRGNDKKPSYQEEWSRPRGGIHGSAIECRVRVFLVDLCHFGSVSEDLGALPVVWEEDGALTDDGDVSLLPDHKTTTKAMPQIKPTTHDTKIALKNILHMVARSAT
jgi:hypothetical protein